ncbi:MAG TPA: hypothetical protein VE568_16110 [Rubrobacter sp.]|nr:hypothetical protein [Rubrobacter sp.]
MLIVVEGLSAVGKTTLLELVPADCVVEVRRFYRGRPPVQVRWEIATVSGGVKRSALEAAAGDEGAARMRIRAE